MFLVRFFSGTCSDYGLPRTVTENKFKFGAEATNTLRNNVYVNAY